jgi:hypothetical protein
MAHHDLPGVNANAHVDLRQAGLAIRSIGGVQAQLHGEGTGDRPFSIVIAAEGCSKQHLQAIAQNLNNRPPVGENDLHHRLQIAIDKGHDLLGLKAPGKGRKVTQVRHQNGHHTQFPTEL